ncbi:hypothetical protein [Corynebacterium neomassiliense]|uniref:hypothetical protein n=1 Tax=Corynebacterium neomassiliense TaxID=2079482 RepID=UPI001030E013|nr:hypothetical protein [Corynebacterium neomassiliense]
MYSISLNDGESESLEDRGMLKIQVFPVGAENADLRVTVAGEGILCMNPNPSLAVVTSVPTAATITVTHGSGGVFPIEQSVRVSVTRGAEATVEFPIVRVGGVSEKLLGRISHEGDRYVFTAFGSSDSEELPGSVMAVSSALRAHLTEVPTISRIHLTADTGATFGSTVPDEDLAAAVTVVRGVSGTLGADTVDLTTGGGRRGEVPCSSLEGALRSASEADSTRVGAEVLPRPADLPPDELSIHLTATPVSGMFSSTAPSLVIALGTGAPAEQELYAMSPDRTPRTGFIAITGQLSSAINGGDGSAFTAGAAVVAGVLSTAREEYR